MITVDTRKYETRPLQCWNKAKELRYNFFKEFSTGRKQGKIVSLGGTLWCDCLLHGIGDVIHLGGEVYGAAVGSDPPFAQACAEAVEAKGYSRDLCAWTKSYWGSVLLDRYYFGGTFPRPDFVITRHICDSHAKWFQTIAEHYDVPFFAMEMPVGNQCDERQDERVEYAVAQMQEAIEWLEKTTGRKFDDERFIEAVYNEWESGRTWAEVCALNKAIPAPLDLKSIYSLFVIAAQARHRKETVEFNYILRDEVKERVQKGIAAIPAERCRLVTDVPPPFYFLGIYRHAENYGAVFVGSEYTFCLAGSWEVRDDGHWSPAKSLKEMGIEMKTREDALGVMARWWDECGHTASF